MGGANKSDFVFMQAHQNAQEVFKTFKLAQADSRESFVKNLEAAISKMNN